MSVSEFKNERFSKYTKGYKVEVFDYNNSLVNGRTLLNNVRLSA